MKIAKINTTSQPNAFAVSSGALRVTDPCYTPDTWCAGTLENVKNGIWQAHVGYHKDEFDTQMAESRIANHEKERLAHIDSTEAMLLERFKDDAATCDLVRQDHATFRAHLATVTAESRLNLANYGGRVAYLHIRHENTQSHFDHEAEFDSTWVDSTIDVGVDSGQAGFFDLALYQQVWESEPVKEKFYDEVCALTCDTDGDWGVHPVGCVSSTGWGDGSYTCLVRRDEELRLIEAIIIYMAEDEDEEDDGSDD